MNDFTTYVLHCKKLAERKFAMESQLAREEFKDVIWYTDYDAEDLTGDLGEDFYKGVNAENFTHKVKSTGWDSNEHRPRHLRPAEISLTTKFGMVFDLISNNPNPYSVIFEDDAILCRNFLSHMDHYLKNTPDDWDVIYMGCGADLRPDNIQPGVLAYKKDHPASRCADSIIVKREAAGKIFSTYFPFDLCSDWEIGYQQALHDLNVYWWEPALVVQGSEIGAFKSSLR